MKQALKLLKFINANPKLVKKFHEEIDTDLPNELRWEKSFKIVYQIYNWLLINAPRVCDVITSHVEMSCFLLMIFNDSSYILIQKNKKTKLYYIDFVLICLSYAPLYQIGYDLQNKVPKYCQFNPKITKREMHKLALCSMTFFDADKSYNKIYL